jgi:hypothetical protein
LSARSCACAQVGDVIVAEVQPDRPRGVQHPTVFASDRGAGSRQRHVLAEDADRPRAQLGVAGRRDVPGRLRVAVLDHRLSDIRQRAVTEMIVTVPTSTAA